MGNAYQTIEEKRSVFGKNIPLCDWKDLVEKHGTTYEDVILNGPREGLKGDLFRCISCDGLNEECSNYVPHNPELRKIWKRTRRQQNTM